MKKILLICALLLTIPFLVCHAAGFREHTGVLSGTHPAVDAAATGLTYAAVYMGFVILAPIFALAAGGLLLLEHGLGAIDKRNHQEIQP